MRGGVLETERVKHARRGEVQWCRGLGILEPVFREDMDAEGAKAVSLRWVDTDKGRSGSTKLQVLNGRARDQERPCRNPMFPPCSRTLQRNATEALSSLCSSPTVRKGEGQRCTAPAVRTSMEYQCDECSWTSQMRRKRGPREPTRSETRWLAVKSACMAQCVQSQQSLSVCGRDIRLLVHGDDFMLAMHTHEEQWFESVL